MKWPLPYNLGRAQREKRGQELTRIARTFFNMYCFCICNYFFVFVFVKWPLLYNLGRAHRVGERMTKVEAGKGIAAN